MNADKEVFYVVSVLRQWSSLQVMGLPLNATQDPHCIGFLPVFDTWADAEAWKSEHEHPTAAILPIALGAT